MPILSKRAPPLGKRSLSIINRVNITIICGWVAYMQFTGVDNADVHALSIFSIFLPFANSSTNLSKYLACLVKGFSISSIR